MSSREVALGALATPLLALLIGVGVVASGHAPVRADAAPLPGEKQLAGFAIDAAAGRGASEVAIPAASEADLRDGLHVYAQNCAICHGASDMHPSQAVVGLAVPPPQFGRRGLARDPEGETVWKVRHGIRFTGMPAFGKVLTDAQIANVSAFLKELKTLPPAVDREWKALPSERKG